MNHKKQLGVSLLLGLAAGMVAVSTSPSARANVYATNIKLNGSLTNNATSSTGSPVTISYILNDAATAGTTINILSNTTVVDTFSITSGSPGTLFGLNTVTWDGKLTGGATAGAGTYGVSVTVASTGYTNWTQISVDSSNTAAVFPHGMAVDNNTNSPYFGRIVVGCDTDGTAHGATQKVGLYKLNADGSPADEGTFAYAGYTTNDALGFGTNEMAKGTNTINLTSTHLTSNPYGIRIGEDDRIYWVDNSFNGQIVSTDILGITNQIVIGEGAGSGTVHASYAYPNNPHTYAGNGTFNLVNAGGSGIKTFDILNAGTSNAVIFLVDYGDYPNWGIWMFHLVDGASDTNDTAGTQAVATGGDLFVVTGAGIMVDTNLDIFCSQYRSNPNDVTLRSFLFTNWNGGVLPPEAGGFNYAEVSGSAWSIGSSDNTLTDVKDTVIDNRQHPKYVALPTIPSGSGTFSGGIRVLNAADGTVVTVTNGATVTQTLTNFDYPNQYFCAAWDGAGNLYGASPTANYVRSWSPPGPNSATTVAFPAVTLGQPVTPFSLGATSLSSGTITINFTATSGLATTAFTLYGSATPTPASGYTAVSGATFTSLGGGSYKVTAPASASAQFYRISHN